MDPCSECYHRRLSTYSFSWTFPEIWVSIFIRLVVSTFIRFESYQIGDYWRVLNMELNGKSLFEPFSYDFFLELGV